MTGALRTVLARELRLAARARAAVLQPLLFFGAVTLLFALGDAPGAGRAATAAAVAWISAVLAALLTLSSMFRDEDADGTLEQWLLSPTPLPLLVAGKAAGQWLLTGLPLTLAAPAAALALGLPASSLPVLLAGLLLGLPALSLLAAFAAGLTLGLPRAGLLVPVLVLPLAVPLVVFGAGAVRAHALGAGAEAPLYLLAAILALAMSGLPLATAAALRLRND